LNAQTKAIKVATLDSFYKKSTGSTEIVEDKRNITSTSWWEVKLCMFYRSYIAVTNSNVFFFETHNILSQQAASLKTFQSP
jgi:hypothetical protein